MTSQKLSEKMLVTGLLIGFIVNALSNSAQAWPYKIHTSPLQNLSCRNLTTSIAIAGTGMLMSLGLNAATSAESDRLTQTSMICMTAGFCCAAAAFIAPSQFNATITQILGAGTLSWADSNKLKHLDNSELKKWLALAEKDRISHLDWIADEARMGELEALQDLIRFIDLDRLALLDIAPAYHIKRGLLVDNDFASALENFDPRHQQTDKDEVVQLLEIRQHKARTKLAENNIAFKTRKALYGFPDSWRSADQTVRKVKLQLQWAATTTAGAGLALKGLTQLFGIADPRLNAAAQSLSASGAELAHKAGGSEQTSLYLSAHAFLDNEVATHPRVRSELARAGLLEFVDEVRRILANGHDPRRNGLTPVEQNLLAGVSPETRELYLNGIDEVLFPVREFRLFIINHLFLDRDAAIFFTDSDNLDAMRALDTLEERKNWIIRQLSQTQENRI